MSMYWWLRQKQLTCCGTDFGWEGGVWYNVVMAIARGMSPKKTLSPFGGCQLHMVMGHRCCSRHVYDKPMDDVVRAAKARIDQLFFVGITSEWFNSVCLFNYKMTGVRYVTALQLENCRPGGLAVLNKRWNSTLEKHLQFHLGNMTDYKGHRYTVCHAFHMPLRATPTYAHARSSKPLLTSQAQRVCTWYRLLWEAYYCATSWITRYMPMRPHASSTS